MKIFNGKKAENPTGKTEDEVIGRGAKKQDGRDGKDSISALREIAQRHEKTLTLAVRVAENIDRMKYAMRTYKERSVRETELWEVTVPQLMVDWNGSKYRLDSLWKFSFYPQSSEYEQKYGKERRDKLQDILLWEIDGQISLYRQLVMMGPGIAASVLKGKANEDAGSCISELVAMKEELLQTPYRGDPLPKKQKSEAIVLTEEQWGALHTCSSDHGPSPGTVAAPESGDDPT